MRGFGYWFGIFSLALITQTGLAAGFGHDGLTTTKFSNFFDSTQRIVLHPDGAVSAVGFTFNNKTMALQIAIAKVTADGSPDLSFGTKGQTTLSMPKSANDFAQSARLLPDGKMLVCGSSFIGDDPDFLVARLLPNGAIDPTFGKKGASTVDVNFGSTDFGSYLDIQADGKIVMAGVTTINNDTFDPVIVRMNSDGTVDPSFGSGGQTIFIVGKRKTNVTEVLIRKDGTIVIPGSALNDNAAWLMGLDADGQPLKDFGTNGVIETHLPDATNVNFFAAALQDDGKILMAGNADIAKETNMVVLRYLPNGDLDPSFGKNGIQSIKLGADIAGTARAIALSNDGKIWLSGAATLKTGQQFAVLRLLPNGPLDETFGDKGKTLTEMADRNIAATGIALQADGKAVVIGDGSLKTGMNLNPNLFIFARYLPDGKLDRQ